MIKVAIIGFGGIAQLHRWAYWHLTRQGLQVQLVAACDTNPKAFTTTSEINLPIPSKIENELPFKPYTDWEQMLNEVKPDLVDICLPTRFHEQVTVAALEMGCSVLCEKPMAEDFQKCLNMLNAAKNSKGELMIGQCVRFYPQYNYLYNVVKANTYGKVIEAEFERVSALPNWNANNWRQSDNRFGSCLTELNVHDIDVMQYIFGLPKSLSCNMESITTPNDRAQTTFNYSDFSVKILSKWLDNNGKFRMSYKVRFEKGTLTFNGENVYFTDSNGFIDDIKLSNMDGIVNEIEYFIRTLNNHTENTKNPPEQSALTIYMIDKCFESAEQAGTTLKIDFT